jgi:hypothetical protein
MNARINGEIAGKMPLKQIRRHKHVSVVILG